MHYAISAVRRSPPLPSTQIRLARPPASSAHYLFRLGLNEGSDAGEIRADPGSRASSASKRTGCKQVHGSFLIFWDPGRRLVAGPTRGPRCFFQDPIRLAALNSFLGRHLTIVHHHRDPVAMRLITATFARGRGGGCLWCGRDGPGNFVGSPSH